MTDQTPPPPPPPPPSDPPGPPVSSNWSATAPSDVASQVEGSSARSGDSPAWQGGGTIWNEPVLVVNQKAKLIELTNEYNVYDQAGNQIGMVREVGQSKAKKALRLVSSIDQFLTHHLDVTDAEGNLQLRLTRPGKVFKSKVLVFDANEAEIGQIVQENVFGKIRFGLQAGGQTHGSIKAENWRAWDFVIEDQAGNEVGRITKTWEGLGKAMFTTADHYVVKIHQPLADPLRSLVVASALAVDTALKQDSN